MKNKTILAELSTKFALRIINLYKYLISPPHIIMKHRILVILILSQLLTFSPSHPLHAQSSYTDFVRQGMDALAVDSLAKAEMLFNKALALEPTHQGSHLLFRYIGQIQERLGRNEDALATYTKGINQIPGNTNLLLDRSALYYHMGNEERALSGYSDVLELQPENTEALLMRAHIYAGKHDYKRARADYETILSIDPMNENAYIGLILVNDRSGRPREAMEQISSLIALFPNHAILYAIRGGMEQQRKQYELALPDLTRAIQLEPTNADYYVSRATLYLDMKKRKLARQDTQMAVKLGADPKEMASILKK